jgi:hypothetical protein
MPPLKKMFFDVVKFIMSVPVHVGRRFHESNPSVMNMIRLDFQEAQCFLLLATQIISLIAVHGSKNFLEAANVVELAVNYVYAEVIGALGLLLPTFVWALIFSKGEGMSAYLHILTLVTAILSAASLGSKYSNPFSAFTTSTSSVAAKLGGISFAAACASCAYHQPPKFYCGILADPQDSAELVENINISIGLTGFFFIYCVVYLFTTISQSSALSFRWRVFTGSLRPPQNGTPVPFIAGDNSFPRWPEKLQKCQCSYWVAFMQLRLSFIASWR